MCECVVCGGVWCVVCVCVCVWCECVCECVWCFSDGLTNRVLLKNPACFN